MRRLKPSATSLAKLSLCSYIYELGVNCEGYLDGG